MGIREYWLVDQQQSSPLWGYTLDDADGTPCSLTTYRLIEADAEGSMDSQVLDASLRWGQGSVECWYTPWETWVSVEALPVMQVEIAAARKGKLKTWERMLHRLLDAAAPGAADQSNATLGSQSPQTWPSDATLDQLEATLGAWRQLLLSETLPNHDGG